MYNLTSKSVTIEDETCIFYGIEYDGHYFADDLSADINAVSELVRLCNEYKLDPVHLRDIAEDFLAEYM